MGFDSANLNNPTDMRQQYGQTPYSRPHRFIVSYQYNLPVRSDGRLEKLVEGWSVSGVTVVQSGNPITFFDSRGGSAYGMLSSGTYENGLSRAQLCPGVTYDQITTEGSVKERLGRTGDPNATRFFNASAFCAPPTIDGGTGFGNTGVGIVRGPGQANFDFSITKMTPVGENRRVEFRTEFFNLFNHAQFAIPVGTQAGGLAGNQTIYPSNPNLFGVITGTSVNPRLVQFALRVQF